MTGFPHRLLARWAGLATAISLAACSGSTRNQPTSPGGLPGEKPWPRLHRLLDAFDAARFADDEASRQTLARDLAGSQTLGRGPAATNQVIEQLQIEADALLARDRLHGGAITARTLLDYDRSPPTSRDQIWQRMVELKAIAGSEHALAGNARLRLFGYCRRALDDAARLSRRAAAAAVAHCLYPLYDSDPAPYVAADPAGRPPPPDPAVLVEDAGKLLGGGDWGRLEPVRDHLVADLEAFARDRLDELPAPPALDAAATLSVPGAPFYDWAPIVTVTEDGLAPSIDDLRVAVQSDGRRQVAARLMSGTAEQLQRLAEHAVAGGASELQVLVETEQKLSVPPGDYWTGRTSGPSVNRVGYLPLSLAKSGAPVHADAERAAEHGRGARAMDLHLHLTRDTVRVLAPAGVIAEVAADDGDGIERTLTKLRSAYPDERTLTVVSSKDVPIDAAMTTLARAARVDGKSRFGLRLSEQLPKPAAGSRLARQVDVRASATITLEPGEAEPLQKRVATMRACYQNALVRKPRLSGTVSLHRQGTALAARGAHPDLARCAREALDDAMNRAEIEHVTVTFTAKR